jgi:hypothetical protein
MEHSSLLDGNEQGDGNGNHDVDRISEPLAPHLAAPVAPFAGKSKKKIAATAAKYYGECTLQVNAETKTAINLLLVLSPDNIYIMMFFVLHSSGHRPILAGYQSTRSG